MIVPVDHVEPSPRRVRGYLGGAQVFDTTGAQYVWEWPNYPQYYIPLADIDRSLLVDEHETEQSSRGIASLFGLRAGGESRPRTVRVLEESEIPGLAGTAHFEWPALDAWYEEDEQVFVHPRSPYTRVDALRSTRSVRVELEGVTLAETSSPVLVFETGLPTRYYLNPLDVRHEHLVPSDTVTSCPYKGRTTGYWSIRAGGTLHEDLAWSYDFPTRQLLPITGLIAFYDEKVDVFVDGEQQARPVTHFFRT
jgi:uncharacterized protein (DUF427 family)